MCCVFLYYFILMLAGALTTKGRTTWESGGEMSKVSFNRHNSVQSYWIHILCRNALCLLGFRGLCWFSSVAKGPELSAASWLLLLYCQQREPPLRSHLSSSCCSRGFASPSGVLTLSVLTMHVGRWRLSMRISCCRSSLSSSICALRSEFNISSRSDSFCR